MRLVVLIILLVLSGFATFGQIRPVEPNQDKPISNGDGNKSGFSKERMFTGGNFWLQLGSFTIIDISPSLGYKVTEELRDGAGISYQYFRQNTGSGILSESRFGYRVFSSYQLFKNAALYAEYERLRLRDYWYNGGQHVWINNLWLGGAYRQWLGPNSAVDLLVLYDARFDNNPAKPFMFGNSPWTTRITFMFGF